MVISWKFTLVMFSTVPLVVFGSVIYGDYVSDYQEVFQTSLAEASAFAQEVLSQITTVKAFAKEEQSVEKFGAKIQDTHVIGVRISALKGIDFLLQINVYFYFSHFHWSCRIFSSGSYITCTLCWWYSCNER